MPLHCEITAWVERRRSDGPPKRRISTAHVSARSKTLGAGEGATKCRRRLIQWRGVLDDGFQTGICQPRVPPVQRQCPSPAMAILGSSRNVISGSEIRRSRLRPRKSAGTVNRTFTRRAHRSPRHEAIYSATNGPNPDFAQSGPAARRQSGRPIGSRRDRTDNPNHKDTDNRLEAAQSVVDHPSLRSSLRMLRRFRHHASA